MEFALSINANKLLLASVFQFEKFDEYSHLESHLPYLLGSEDGFLMQKYIPSFLDALNSKRLMNHPVNTDKTFNDNGIPGFFSV